MQYSPGSSSHINSPRLPPQAPLLPPLPSQKLRLNLNLFGKFSRTTPRRDHLIRSIVAACILRDRVITTQVRAEGIRKLCNAVVDIAKGLPENKDASKCEELTCMFHDNHLALEKLRTTLVPRYALRNSDYVRIIPHGQHPYSKHKLAMLEYVDAPGDTLVELARREIPALTTQVADLNAKIDALNSRINECQEFLPDITMLKPSERIGMTAVIERGRLEATRRRLSERISEHQRVLNLEYLPDGYNEVKWPPADVKIWVETIPVYTRIVDKELKPNPPSRLSKLRNPEYRETPEEIARRQAAADARANLDPRYWVTLRRQARLVPESDAATQRPPDFTIKIDGAPGDYY